MAPPSMVPLLLGALKLAKGTVSIDMPPVRASIDVCPRVSSDTHYHISGDARITEETQAPTCGVDAQGAPANEGTSLVEAVEAAYEETAPPLISNKGERSSLHVYIFACMHIYFNDLSRDLCSQLVETMPRFGLQFSVLEFSPLVETLSLVWVSVLQVQVTR